MRPAALTSAGSPPVATSPERAFYSAINAESEGREGKFYVWSQEEIRDILSDTKLEVAEYRFGITEEGNFIDPHHQDIKGMNVLEIQRSVQEISEKFNISSDDCVAILEDIRQELFKSRLSRIKPSVDTKIIVSWNALMIKSLFVAAEALDFEDAAIMAIKSLDFIIDNMIGSDKLIRTYYKKVKSKTDAVVAMQFYQIENYLDVLIRTELLEELYISKTE